MTDKTAEIEQEENTATETETGEKATGSNQTNKQATFTQAQVNEIVAKEKRTWKKQSDTSNAEHETIVEGLRKEIADRDELISSQVDLLRKDLEIPDEDWEFLSSGKSALEQYQFLMKKMEKANKEEMPRTPKGQRKEKEFQTSFRASI